MFIESIDMRYETRENMRGGNGSVSILDVVPKEHLPVKARLFSLVTLDTGCGIGRHEHSGESEVFYMLSGEGVLDNNGTVRTMRAGDCHVCKSGEYHAISNEREETLRLIAAIILE